MKREHLLLLKGKIEEIEEKIADLKALLSLIEVWEGKGEENEEKNEHKLEYKVHTQTGSSVITITLTETNESKQTVEKFIQTLDAEVTEMLKRKLVKFEKIGGEKSRTHRFNGGLARPGGQRKS